MEIHNSTPKNWAQYKRSQRYSDPLEKRKAHPNGQLLRTMYEENYFTKNSTLFTFDKSIRRPGIDTDTSPQKTIFGHTPFERELNIGMINDKEYSLNRHKNWEKIPAILQEVECDEKYVVSRGKAQKWGDLEVEITKIGYFDLDEMRIQTDQLHRAQSKYDRDLTDNVTYIRDRHFATIQRQEYRKHLKRWKEFQCTKPKGISRRSDFIPLKTITASTVSSGCKVRMATVRSFGKRSFWTPKRQNDDRDFIQIDLGKDYVVEAVTTRGRTMRRNGENEPVFDFSYNEFVKKYRIKIRVDDAHHEISQVPPSDVEQKWIDLGVKEGNRDCETEKVTKLSLRNDGRQHSSGVLCRYIRIYPLSASDDGFHGAKSMRIGVYGYPPDVRVRSRENGKNVGNESEVEPETTDQGSGELINDKSVPAAIITIRQPSKLKRNRWAVVGRAEGVYGSNYGRRDNWGVRAQRKRARNGFRQQVKRLRRVSDYDWDHEWITM